MGDIDRIEAARRLAAARGWTLWHRTDYMPPDSREVYTPCFVMERLDIRDGMEHGPTWDGENFIDFPAHDAPLHEQMEFVGRLAEAVSDHRIENIHEHSDGTWTMRLIGREDDAFETYAGYAPDLVHAGLLAAIAAVEGRKGT